MTIWTKEMRDKLVREYPTVYNAVLAAELGVSVWALAWKARRLGLSKEKPWHIIVWTDVMLDRLREEYPVCSVREVAARLGISKSAVEKKARKLGLTKADMSKKERKVEETVKDNFGLMSCRKIGEKAGVSARTVGKIARKLGLTMPEESKRQLRCRTMGQAFYRERLFRSCGLTPDMDRTFGFDKSRTNIEYRLAEDGYFVTRHCDVVYYTSTLKRHPIRERHAERMGMVFLEYPLEYLISGENEGAQAPEDLINSSTMVITGKIIAESMLRQGTNDKGHEWKAREYVLETQEEYPQKCLLTVWGDNIGNFNIQVGEQLTAEFKFVVNGKEGHWFGSNRVVSVTRV